MAMSDIDELRNRQLDELLQDAWSIREKNFEPVLAASAPSAKTYISDYHRNEKGAFINVSITGSRCSLNCEHCNGTLLETMRHIATGDELVALGEQLADEGCQGILVSGGSTPEGDVKLDDFYNGIARLKELGLKVLVHTGLATRETAKRLADIGVDQVLLDIIGDEETIKGVYHLDKSPEDFYNSMKCMLDAGLDVVPHILIGLNYGKIAGEYAALDMVTKAGCSTIIFVVLNPTRGTAMEKVEPTQPEEVGRLVAAARIANPRAIINMGCARPPQKKVEMEALALGAGINGIAYPTDETIKLAVEKGLMVTFKDTCCSLL
jgi:uncharacterized radical SAM superfamily protein